MRDMDIPSMQRAVTMIKAMEYFSYGEKLKELGLFRLEKRRLKGSLLKSINT